MKKALLSLVLAVLLLGTPVLTVLACGLALPPQFDETYYGALPDLYEELRGADRKKIVLIGNSSLAFGVRTDWMEQELPDYDVVLFGLYGALGTRLMLDLSRDMLAPGDLVVIAPEQYEQSLSLYFSGVESWKALETAPALLGHLTAQDLQTMAGAFPSFALEKWQTFSGGTKPAGEGAYRRDAFSRDGFFTGYMTFPREGNLMLDGYDPNNPVRFASAMVEPAFLDYLNDYAAYASRRGAQVCFDFSPVNKLALDEDTDMAALDTYYAFLCEHLDFPVIGDPNQYLFDWEWFYDNNFHMNSAGMALYTRQLLEDIKGALGITTPTNIQLPEKPSATLPEATTETATTETAASDSELFTFRVEDSGAVITGLTQQAAGMTELTLPDSWQGQPVVAFTTDVFAGNTALETLVIPASVRVLYDGSFDGCTRLRAVVLQQSTPSLLGVGGGLLEGAPACSIHVPNDALSLYQTHYSWSLYQDRLTAY